MKKRILQFLCFVLLLMALPLGNEAIAQAPLNPINLTLSYNQSANTATANWNNPSVALINQTFTWKDQAGLIIASGTPVYSPIGTAVSSIIVPVSASSITFTLTSGFPTVNTLANETMYFDIVIDDDVIFKAIKEIKDNEGCKKLCETFTTSAFTRQRCYHKPFHVLSPKDDVLTLIRRQLCACKGSCPPINKDAFMKCFRNNKNQVFSIPSKDLSKAQNSNTSNTLTYPNPFDQQLTFEFTTENEGDVHIQLFDAMGRIVIQQKETLPSGGEQRIELSTDNLQQGVYYYRLLLNGELHTSGKVIK